jgi:hypothetical protein
MQAGSLCTYGRSAPTSRVATDAAFDCLVERTMCTVRNAQQRYVISAGPTRQARVALTLQADARQTCGHVVCGSLVKDMHAIIRESSRTDRYRLLSAPMVTVWLHSLCFMRRCCLSPEMSNIFAMHSLDERRAKSNPGYDATSQCVNIVLD